MRAFCIGLVVWLATLGAVQAQNYPTREIHVVVGLPAGSGGDVVARFYAEKLAQLSGKPVIVENKPGMLFSLGAEAVARAQPDGYTLLITSVTSSHAANLYEFKKLPYDPIKDFTPVAMLHKSYFVLMVRPEVRLEDGRGAHRGDEGQGHQGQLRLRQPAGAGIRRTLQNLCWNSRRSAFPIGPR